jgi:hypothetical protein
VAPGTILVCETDEGAAQVPLVPEHTSPGALPTSSTRTVRLRLPQGVLARLALGALPPEGLLDGLETPPSAQDRDLLRRLFPLRQPHMSWPDRY